MEIDLAQLDSSASGGDLLRAPICIIGGGIAGLTLAHKLVRLGCDVLLLEAGGRESQAFDPLAQSGDPHPGTSEARSKAFGGTSLTWGGQLLPLPPASSWPVSAEELAPFSSEAESLLAVDALPYAAPQFFSAIRQPEPALLREIPQIDASFSKSTSFSHRNLAHTLGQELRTHSRARILLRASATELLLADSRDCIEAVLVRTPDGRTLRVAADHVILCAGTVETVRLLLASRSVASEGVGNQYGEVGRNFHDHLTVSAATLRGSARKQLVSALRPWVRGNTLHGLKLHASDALCDRLHLTPVLAHLTIDEPEDSGIAALRNLLRGRQQGNLVSAIRRSIPRLPSALANGARLTFAARIDHRRYVSLRAQAELRLNAAQRTPSASRITLAPDLKPVIDWHIDATEIATLRAFAQHLQTHLTLDGMDWNPALLGPDSARTIPDLDDARHAMGGACMGANARTSVVDSDLRVHGLRNLFVASAAVFPDGSPQLPTLPLMALTLRLAQHLHRQI